MNIAKKLFVQSMVIATSILFLNGINAVIQHFLGNDITLQWYHPITIVLTGVLCALPTILLQKWEEWDRKTLWIRVGLHCLALYAVVAGAGAGRNCPLSPSARGRKLPWIFQFSGLPRAS